MGLLLLILVLFYILPDNVVSVFVNKIFYVFTEIDASQQIDSTFDATSNWRAYEIQATWEQWSHSSILVKIFGAGMGKGTYIEYVPSYWEVVNNEIPILHNGFFTLLSKGGLVAVFALWVLMLTPILKGVCMMKRDMLNTGIIMVAISVLAIANTYVVQGPVRQGVFLVWAILMGWLNSRQSILQDDVT